MPRQWKRPKHHNRTRRTVARMSEAISGNDRAAFAALPGLASLNPGYKKNERKIKGSRTPTDAVRNRLPFGKRAPCRARSPVGVPRRFLSKGLTHPEDSASDQASRSAAPVGGGGIPPAPAPVTASTSRAGHCAGRLMSETARAQRRRNPARGHRNSLPPARVTGRRPCTKSERPPLLRAARAESSRIICMGFCLISLQFLRCGCLAARRGRAVMCESRKFSLAGGSDPRARIARSLAGDAMLAVLPSPKVELFCADEREWGDDAARAMAGDRSCGVGVERGSAGDCANPAAARFSECRSDKCRYRRAGNTYPGLWREDRSGRWR